MVYTPHASMIHHELASRGGLGEEYDLAGFSRRWRARFAAGDPFYSPNLSTEHDDYRPNDEPLRVVHGGGALLDRGAIHRILVVKVDHIGDFVTALPAIRRLKESVPRCRDPCARQPRRQRAGGDGTGDRRDHSVCVLPRPFGARAASSSRRTTLRR